MTPSLPLISLTPFLDPNPSDPLPLQASLAQLSSACRDTGFFYLTDHGIPLSRLNQVLTLARSFFQDASDDEKQSLARKSPDEARGYQRLGENITLGRRDAHEAVDLYSESAHDAPDGILSGTNLWPRTPADLESEMKGYVEQVLSVGRAVVRAMGQALGEEEAFVSATSDSFWVMRMIGYPPLEQGSEAVSCGEHTGSLVSFSLHYRIRMYVIVRLWCDTDWIYRLWLCHITAYGLD
jgi:isopenicillin N synthase-like dioxygenase